MEKILLRVIYFQATFNVVKDSVKNGSCEDGEIVRTRTYDLHITYDKYYQTPRLWLFGYDEVIEIKIISTKANNKF